jgi:histidine triad (HIT) family protein
MSSEQSKTLGLCLKKVKELIPLLGLENGFRLVINQGDDAQQSVPHLHVHILGGQKMGWNPA